MQPMLRARDVRKTFFGRRVLSLDRIELLPGEIHALIGQNGSGKSTFLKILSGYYQPEHGAELEVDGHPVSLPVTPARIRDLGVAFVHQDLALIESGSVVENVRLGRYKSGFAGFVNWRQERRYVATLLSEAGIAGVHPDEPVANLRPMDRARIAIVRAVEQVRHGGTGRLIVLDEPTAHLAREDVERFFATIREIAKTGVSVLIVTHRLEEVREIAHEVTVLRGGSAVLQGHARDYTLEDLAFHMLGFAPGELYPATEWHRGEGDDAAAMRVEGVSGALVQLASFDIGHGEIVGLTGLAGMGWESLPGLLFGVEPVRTGSILIRGSQHELRDWSSRSAVDVGLALVPGDRLHAGGIQTAPVRENLTMPTLGRYFSHGWLHSATEKRRSREILEAYEVSPPQPERVFGTLSGGNQQKAILGKWFETKPEVLLLHEPVQGVDVGAKRAIYRRIRRASDEGTAVVIASAEVEDLVHLCDRVLVFRDGEIHGVFSGDTLTYERVMSCAVQGSAPQVGAAGSHLATP